MGYDLHIHRRGDWHEDGNDIGLEEWLALCEVDPSLTVTGRVEAKNPRTGEIIGYESEGLAEWHSRGGMGDRFLGRRPPSALFDFYRGSIVIKNPDNAAIRKSYDIAQKLNGRVQGDEGEYYGADGEMIR